MRFSKVVILIFTLLFLSSVAFFGSQEWEMDDHFPFSVKIPSEDGAEIINCWKKGSENYYVFLPSYADLHQAEFCVIKDNVLFIDNQPLTDGMSCSAFQKNVEYDLFYTNASGAHQFSVTFVQSGNVPTMYIDVPSGNMDYIHRKKGNEESGLIRLYTKNGDLDYGGNLESIKGRGNATWDREKKAYSLKLSGEADLLGMGNAQKWILLANAYDASHLRNKIAYDVAEAAGMSYSPNCEWVDLYLNGEYVGLYLLSERNEVHPERVDISKDNGFLISREGESRLIDQGYTYFSSDYYLALRVHYSSMSLAELDQKWQSAENAIFAEDGIDPITGKSWLELIDLDSWVMKYLIDEVFANYDGGGISQFFYFDGNDASGKIYAGPVWDMDITLAPGQWEVSPPNCFTARRPATLYGPDNAPFNKLYQKNAFYERMVEMYQTVFRPLLVDLLDTGLDRYVAQISQAAAANQLRWNIKNAAEEAEIIQVFLENRLAFLDDIWIKEEEYCDVLIVIDYEVWAWFAVRPGDCLPYIPEFENSEWCVIDSDEPFDIMQPVYESVNIYLKDHLP